MKLLKSSYCLFLLLCCLGSNAQLLEQTKEGYTFDSIEYNSNADILDLLKEHPRAIESFKGAKRDRKIANVLGATSLLSMMPMVVYFSKISNPGGDSPHYEFFYKTLGAGLIACITGTSGIVFANKSNKKKAKVVDYFNGNLMGQNPSSTNIDVSLRPIENRIGIVLSF